MAVSFISATSGTADRDITVPAGADLMVVALLSTDVTTRTAASFEGEALSAATLTNDYAAIFYMLAPPAEAVGPLTVTPNTNLGADGMVVAFYSTTTSGFTFQAGQEASVGSASYSPSGAGVICHGISATSAGTPVASTNERIDSGSGTWYGDRIVTGSGSVTVGATISDPDYAGAIFLEASGASLTVGTATFASGAASASASALRARSVSASFAAGASSLSAALSRGRAALASFASGAASASASATVTGNRAVGSATFASGAASASASASRGRVASVAAFAAGVATAAASAAISLVRAISSATFASGPATASASASRLQLIGRYPSGEMRMSRRSGRTTITAASSAPTRFRAYRGRTRIEQWTP